MPFTLSLKSFFRDISFSFLQIPERINKCLCLVHAINLQEACPGNGNVGPASCAQQKGALAGIGTQHISTIGADTAMPAGNMRLDLKAVLNLPDSDHRNKGISNLSHLRL